MPSFVFDLVLSAFSHMIEPFFHFVITQQQLVLLLLLLQQQELHMNNYKSTSTERNRY